MKSRLARIAEGTGFLMLMFGAGGMDSNILVAPITLMVCGIVLMFTGAGMEGAL